MTTYTTTSAEPAKTPAPFFKLCVETCCDFFVYLLILKSRLQKTRLVPLVNISQISQCSKHFYSGFYLFIQYFVLLCTLWQDLLRAGLPEAIEKALQGDERCVLDTMRLVDLLLVLLFEGRRALPKSCVSIPKGGIGSLRRFDSSNERSHRQLIDCIRSKDTDAVIDAIENGENFSQL